MTNLTDKTRSLARRLLGDQRGTMVIETAIVAPVLVLMALGGFEVSHMVSRQHELQSGAAEATAVALAANAGAETNTIELAKLLRDSLHLQGEQVVVTKMYRCETSTSYVSTTDQCVNYWSSSDSNNGGGNDATRYSEYVKIKLQDSYTPIWTRLGLGGAFTYKVERTIQLS